MLPPRVARTIARRASSLALLAFLAGCGASSDGPAPVEIGSLSGPWGAEMEQASRSFPSDFSTAVFADGSITEQEFLEAQQIVQDCFSAEGLEASWDAYGFVSVSGPELSSDAPPESMGRCSFADGGVMDLYHQMMKNPENEDDMELRARCLVEAGVLDPGYTGHDLESAYQSEAVPWSPGDEAAQRCLLDPLGRVDPGTTE